MATVCRLDELNDGEALRVDVDGVEVAVVRCGDDVFAIGDQCTHADVSLSEGEVEPDDALVVVSRGQFGLCKGSALKPIPQSANDDACLYSKILLGFAQASEHGVINLPERKAVLCVKRRAVAYFEVADIFPRVVLG